MITSKENSTVMRAAKLNDKKARKEQNKFLVEGIKLLNDCLKCGIVVETVFVSEQNQNIVSEAEVVVVSDSVMKCLSDTKTNQGIVAVAQLPKQKCLSEGNALLLDRIQDPKNLGAILRTCCATGYNDVFLIDCADPYSPKSLRAGMSGQFSLNLIETSEDEFLNNFAGIARICADMNGENVFELKDVGRHILILGNEGQGVSKKLLNSASKTVSIPMKNNLESLNVAVCGGILMYMLTSGNRR